MNNRVELAHEFAEIINSKYINKIVLFGSVARGDDKEDSDIDILIVSNPRNIIWSDLSKAIADIVLEKHELISSLNE
ncbi:nucleotidyltransferase family protein [uncultured Methanobrevibacter sp.]|uniref:nucleotidyltransferase family protein n=1 Tax=uncultured Methanobrevibacter sp. TaxID=253161 RepID=UPI0025FE969B|nr:nucleotidyltransferase domain-containing protein [uncultured Methanobrevibacter sp.]